MTLGDYMSDCEVITDVTVWRYIADCVGITLVTVWGLH